MNSGSSSASAGAPSIEDEGDADEEFQYQEAGLPGPSIDAIKRAATGYFHNFLEKEGKFAPGVTTVLTIVPSESLLKRFATYLAVDAYSKTTKKLISCGSALNYLSQVKETLRNQSREESMWRNADNG
jgi:hypothetical protein